MKATTDVASSSTTANHTTRSKQFDAQVGTLWANISSPLTSAISAVAHISGRKLHQSCPIPIISHILIWMRFGIRATAINSTILQTNEQWQRHIWNIFDIAQYIDSVRIPDRPTIFPSHLLSHISLFQMHAHAIVLHMQKTLADRLGHDLNAAQAILLPPRWRHRFFSLLIVKIYLWWLKRESRSHAGEASKEHARKGLNAIRAALSCYSGKHLRYLCGESVTFADVVVAESIYFDGERYARGADLFRDEEFSEAFPDVVAWARALRSTHYAAVAYSRRQ